MPRSIIAEKTEAGPRGAAASLSRSSLAVYGLQHVQKDSPSPGSRIPSPDMGLAVFSCIEMAARFRRSKTFSQYIAPRFHDSFLAGSDPAKNRIHHDPFNK